ncbi:putative secreted protein (Por secretion system target) [Chryseobacterium sp. CBTAP 102]|uniref:M12 family metallo-peptidase n=1 Tax=Chryseobacterium sp. CBTAP 102 TaxID=2135644 RepID=UPI000D9045DB|nr:M12 family metallo-peptidase [Chryseobacterium sp. CBTAP 102]PXW18140.1 putative secreted protein (Por secretion system target) [Chryseobacterium sp. CBTAP 102]
MKNFLLICFLQCFVLSFSQNLKPVAQKVLEFHNRKSEFKTYDLFETNKSADKTAEYKKAATDITVMSLKSAELKRLIKDKPDFIEISFPFDDGRQIIVEMYRHQILTSDFKVITDKGTTVEYTPGVYYQGIVKGDNASIAAFSFFNNDIVGVASTPESGNIVVGKAKNSEDFVSYSDSKLTGSNPFACDVDGLKENQVQRPVFTPDNTNKKTDNCVRIYYEAGYGPYTQNGSNTTTTTNWVTAMHNNVSTLYANENVNVALSEVFVWTTTDPYTGSPGTILNQFRTTRTTFNGDLAQLLRNPATTSIAYVNSLCTDYRYSYCGTNFNYQNVPTYSWNIEAMTHELGHNLGSPHTHACFWNGNNTAIDGCGPASGNNEGCTAALPPAGGGTIMSYCHLVSSVGINFANGFGVQPGTLIRNTVDSKGCLGTNCIASCPASITNFTITNITQNSANANFTDVSSSSWKYKLTTSNGALVSSGSTNTPSFNFTNLQPATYYRLNAGTNCSGPNAFQLSKLFLTDGAWCDGVQFLDTGGSAGQYGDNEELVKTFYPASGSSLTMTFTAFDLEQGYDYMYVYNGASTASPLFANGNNLSGNTIPGPFTSTDPSGAITVKFVSDGGVTGNGWNVNFSCSVLAVEDINHPNNSIDIYPNPAKNMITVSSKERLRGYKIYDEAGRLIISDSSLKGNKQEINLSSIQTGNYVITVETEKQTINKKLIKQ